MSDEVDLVVSALDFFIDLPAWAKTAIGIIITASCWKVTLNAAGLGSEDPSFRQKALASIRDGGSGYRFYSYHLGRVLNWLSRFLKDDANTGANPGLGSWSGQLLLACMVLASLYPSVAILLGWIIGQQDGMILDLMGLRHGVNQTLRGTTLILIASGLFLVFRSIYEARSKGSSRDHVLLAITGTVCLVLVLLFAFKPAYAAVIGATLVVVTVVSLTGAGWLVGSITGGLLVFSALSFAGVAHYILAFLPLQSDVYRITTLGVSICFSILSGLFIWRFHRARPFLVSVTFIALFMIMAGISAVALSDPEQSQNATYGRVIAFLFLIMPVINSVFDWLSIGLTRFLLLSGLRTSAFSRVFYGFLDAVGAIVLLVLLGLVLFWVLGWLSKMGSAHSVVRGDEILKELQANPWSKSNLWIGMIILTTFLPSAAHLALVLTQLATTSLSRFRHYAEEWMQDPDFQKKKDRVLITSVLIVLPWAVGWILMILLLIWLSRLLPQFLDAAPYVIDWFERSYLASGGR